MICPVCGGSGITRVALLREVFTLPVACGGCGGTGVRADESEDTRPLYERMLAKKIALRGLRVEIDAAEDLPDCYLGLIFAGLGDLARMCEDYRRES